MAKDFLNKKELDSFGLKQAIILLVNGYTATGEYDIENAVDIIQEVITGS